MQADSSKLFHFQHKYSISVLHDYKKYIHFLFMVFPFLSIDFFLSVGAPWVAQAVKNQPAMQEAWVWALVQLDPLEKGMATLCSILFWEIPWTEERWPTTVHRVCTIHDLTESETTEQLTLSLSFLLFDNLKCLFLAVVQTWKIILMSMVAQYYQQHLISIVMLMYVICRDFLNIVQNCLILNDAKGVFHFWRRKIG